ncbi:MAG: zinc metallopeptidase [Verrucomicrobia bacterium]|nr:zinc metallopeptidase [Verrucomicrobiota bacterium]MDE3098253.1 zinc metallopeptidase [Verrucomicrobiota bacterium]
MPYFLSFDPWFYVVLAPGLLLGIWAQIKLSHAYGKYSRQPVDSGMTGAQAAREILDEAGLTDVPVAEIPGHLTDHYDPVKRALFLSPDNFEGRTVAAVGVAAHEAGHALQHQASYALFNFRMALVPVTQFASTAYLGIFFAGLFFGFLQIALPIIIVIFSILTLFQLVTLPVEFDASRRAKAQLFRLGLVHEHERAGVSRVLNAAGLTYVAALVTSILQLLYYLSLSRRR